MSFAPPDQQFTDKNGLMNQRSLIWTQLVTNLQPITGTGSPEGVIDATIGRLYIDTNGVTGSVLYVKQSGAAKTGWILV